MKINFILILYEREKMTKFILNIRKNIVLFKSDYKQVKQKLNSYFDRIKVKIE